MGGRPGYEGAKKEDGMRRGVMTTNITEETKKTRTRLESNLFQKVFCKLGLHRWAGIYTMYWERYGIDWNQYCLYCPIERENPVHIR